MSLTATDLQQIKGLMKKVVRDGVLDRILTRDEIRLIVREETADLRVGLADVQREVGALNTKVDRLEVKVDTFDGRITASENDIRAIYRMIPTKT